MEAGQTEASERQFDVIWFIPKAIPQCSAWICRHHLLVNRHGASDELFWMFDVLNVKVTFIGPLKRSDGHETLGWVVSTNMLENIPDHKSQITEPVKGKWGGLIFNFNDFELPKCCDIFNLVLGNTVPKRSIRPSFKKLTRINELKFFRCCECSHHFRQKTSRYSNYVFNERIIFSSFCCCCC